MKKAAISAVLALTLAGGALATPDLGSIVGSFNATLRRGSAYSFPLGLAYDGSDFWAGYSAYVAEWTQTGSRKNMYYLNWGTNYEAAFDQANNRLYLISSLGANWILAIDPGSGSVINSFLLPFTYPKGLTFGGGYLYIAGSRQSWMLKTTTTGSIAGSIDPKVLAISGLAWDSDTAGGPYLFACVKDANHTIYRINPTNGSVVKSFKGPAFEGNITGLTWDGKYLWACQNRAGRDQYAFQFIAYEPNVGVTPATLGKIKALYR